MKVQLPIIQTVSTVNQQSPLPVFTQRFSPTVSTETDPTSNFVQTQPPTLRQKFINWISNLVIAGIALVSILSVLFVLVLHRSYGYHITASLRQSQNQPGREFKIEPQLLKKFDILFDDNLRVTIGRSLTGALVNAFHNDKPYWLTYFVKGKNIVGQPMDEKYMLSVVNNELVFCRVNMREKLPYIVIDNNILHMEDVNIDEIHLNAIPEEFTVKEYTYWVDARTAKGSTKHSKQQ